MNYILEYHNKIESGEIVACERIKKIYRRLVEEIRSPNGFIFDEARATRPIEFIEKFCKHSKGEWSGKAVKLELFQKAFIQALFGFIDPQTGFRKYKEAFFLVARKNGKSTLLSGLALYMLIADGEGGAEVYSVATKLQQSSIIFNEVVNMVNQSPALKKHLKKRKLDLYFEKTFSKCQALSSKNETLDGLNSHFVIIDEMHAIKSRGLYEVMKQSMSARRQPVLVTITTAGTVRGNIFDDLYEYACKVADGVLKDDEFLPILYELDAKEEWKSEECWTKANPALDSIKKRKDLQNKVERARQNPSDMAGVLCKDFNVRETLSNAWLSFDDINNEEVFDLEEFRNSFAIAGVDLSKTRDLTCATVLMMKKGSDKKYLHQMYFLPEDNFFQRVNDEKIPYDKWRERGLLRLCQGNTINYSDVVQWFLELVNDYGLKIAWVYYESWSSTYFVEEMELNGFEMVKCIQGYKTLSIPIELFGADLQKKNVIYNNNPLLKWCMTNVALVEDRNGNHMPIKNQSAKQRIDGFASALNCYVGLYEHYNEFVDALE